MWPDFQSSDALPSLSHRVGFVDVICFVVLQIIILSGVRDENFVTVVSWQSFFVTTQTTHRVLHPMTLFFDSEQSTIGVAPQLIVCMYETYVNSMDMIEA